MTKINLASSPTASAKYLQASSVRACFGPVKRAPSLTMRYPPSQFLNAHFEAFSSSRLISIWKISLSVITSSWIAFTSLPCLIVTNLPLLVRATCGSAFSKTNNSFLVISFCLAWTFP
eukprot:Pompholyxophrys_sp_v1_NODE_152_length_1503_cov_156.640193.p3 type:complete len:118 gc:universal NODE_152_length_1503_cov_156.640193:1286-933(-)